MQELLIKDSLVRKPRGYSICSRRALCQYISQTIALDSVIRILIIQFENKVLHALFLFKNTSLRTIMPDSGSEIEQDLLP